MLLNKLIPIMLMFSILVSACQKTNSIDQIKSNEVKIHQDTNAVRHTEIKNVETLIENKEIFYLTSNDIFDMPKDVNQHMVSMDLVIYNNCLSVKSIGEEEYFTFVLSDEKEILFDENKNIIGLINLKSKKKFLIGERIGLNGTNGVNATSSKKTSAKRMFAKCVSNRGVLSNIEFA